MDSQYDFETYWTLIQSGADFDDRKDAARDEWNKHPEKHVAIINWLKKHGPYVGRNPFFFIQDFKIRKAPGLPDFLRGDEEGPIVQVKYEGKFKLCRPETAEQFHLTVTNEKWKLA